MKRFIAVTFALWNFFCASCFGWGVYGHRVIAEIAERNCRPETKKKINELLGEKVPLQDIANWADDIAKEKKVTARWHYVNIPRDDETYDPDRHCPSGGCLISAIEDFESILCNADAKKSERAEALKFLVHLIGDLHQPLHCGYREDLGGTTLAVTFFGRKTNLHKVWDTDILSREQIPFDEYVEKLLKKVSPNKMDEWTKGNVMDWVNECRALLVDYVYDFDSDRKLGAAYYSDVLPVVDDQLLKGGLRLAATLNRCLAGQ